MRSYRATPIFAATATVGLLLAAGAISSTTGSAATSRVQATAASPTPSEVKATPVHPDSPVRQLEVQTPHPANPTAAPTVRPARTVTALGVHARPPGHTAAASTTPATAQDPTRITVRGGWTNDVPCVPRAVSKNDTTVNFECSGGSAYDGDFAGRTITYFQTQIDLKTSQITGQFEEMIIGPYSGDHSIGALHTQGTFAIDENGAFHAVAEIVGGTCSWTGSKGSITYDGYQTNGGYVGTWVRPAQRPAVDPTCNPIDWVPGVTQRKG